MSELLTAEKAAMETIRVQLNKELEIIQTLIENAIRHGKTEVYYDGNISLATKQILEVGGYTVYHYNCSSQNIS